MKKKTIILIVVLVILLIVVVLLRGDEDTWICVDGQWAKHGNPSAPKPTEGCGEEKEVNSFQECVDAGYPVLESYPQRCLAPNGQSFTEDIGNELEKMDLIRIDNPRPNQEVSSPIEIKGQARGSWFFEATFPVKLLDEQGNQLAAHYVTAKGDWMTEDFVLFEGLLEFDISEETDATLVLEKDNPSGLPENADELRVPIHLIPSALSEIKGWKVYTNKEKGFSINYPSEMTLTNEADGIKFLLLGPTQREGTELYDGIIFYVFKEIYNQATLKDFVDAEVEKERQSDLASVEDPEEFILSGMNGYYYRVEGLGIFTNIIIDVGSGEAIKIVYLASDPKNQGFQQTVNTMMSTLKLIK